MSFVLSQTFVKEVRRISPLKPVTIHSTWFDDEKGIIAQIDIIHKRKGFIHSILISINKESTNKSVFNQIRRKMLHWHKIAK